MIFTRFIFISKQGVQSRLIHLGLYVLTSRLINWIDDIVNRLILTSIDNNLVIFLYVGNCFHSGFLLGCNFRILVSTIVSTYNNIRRLPHTFLRIGFFLQLFNSTLSSTFLFLLLIWLLDLYWCNHSNISNRVLFQINLRKWHLLRIMIIHHLSVWSEMDWNLWIYLPVKRNVVTLPKFELEFYLTKAEFTARYKSAFGI